MSDERDKRRKEERSEKPRKEDDAKARPKDEKAERPRKDEDEKARDKRKDEEARDKRKDEEARDKRKDEEKARDKRKDEEKARDKRKDEEKARDKRKDEEARDKRKDEEKARDKRKDEEDDARDKAREKRKEEERSRAKEEKRKDEERARSKRPEPGAPAGDDAEDDDEVSGGDEDGAAAAAVAAAGGEAPRKRTVEELMALLRGRPRTLADGSIFVNDKLLKAIARRGERAIGPVLELLGDKRFVVRYAACAALQRLAMKSEGELPFALPRLVERLDDESPQVRGKAIEALASIRTQKAEVESALTKALGDANADVSRLAVMHTVELSTDARKTTERMIELLTTKRSVYPRVGALMVLFHLGKTAKEALPHLVEAISDPSPEVREYANLALMGIRTPSMRLQIIRTSSMRLKAVDETAQSESADATGSKEDVGSEDDTEPTAGATPRRKLRRRRRRLG